MFDIYFDSKCSLNLNQSIRSLVSVELMSIHRIWINTRKAEAIMRVSDPRKDWHKKVVLMDFIIAMAVDFICLINNSKVMNSAEGMPNTSFYVSMVGISAQNAGCTIMDHSKAICLIHSMKRISKDVFCTLNNKKLPNIQSKKRKVSCTKISKKKPLASWLKQQDTFGKVMKMMFKRLDIKLEKTLRISKTMKRPGCLLLGNICLTKATQKVLFN